MLNKSIFFYNSVLTPKEQASFLHLTDKKYALDFPILCGSQKNVTVSLGILNEY